MTTNETSDDKPVTRAGFPGAYWKRCEEEKREARILAAKYRAERAERRWRAEEQAAEIERLKNQAAEDIIWMSGIGPIPDEGLRAWGEIQDRWLR